MLATRLPLLLKENNFDKDIVFTLVGDGRNKVNLLDQIEHINVSHMFKFVDQVPANEIPSMLSDADVAFISFNDNELFRMTIPAKLQTYMACGKPILAVAQGETSKIIIESHSGLVSSPRQVNALYENIIKFRDMSLGEIEEFGYNAFRYANAHFNKNRLMDQFDKLIDAEG
jgi:glycosyltransferase involved in cell wall biosynthesis